MPVHELILDPDPERALRAIQAASQQRPVLLPQQGVLPLDGGELAFR